MAKTCSWYGVCISVPIDFMYMRSCSIISLLTVTCTLLYKYVDYEAYSSVALQYGLI